MLEELELLTIDKMLISEHNLSHSVCVKVSPVSLIHVWIMLSFFDQVMDLRAHFEYLYAFVLFRL